MIRALVVEDSAVVRQFLLHIFRSDPEIEVVGVARNGEEALTAAEQVKPDVITMDIHMPGMNGFEATRRIMQTRPTPIVIVSATADVSETAKAFHAVEAGALALIQRPPGVGHPDHQRTAAELVQTVKLMSEIKVVRRWPRHQPGGNGMGLIPARRPYPMRTPVLVAIGASTGGPPVLQAILSQLPGNFPAAVLLVQHIATGFTEGFTDWLSHSCTLRVRVAADGESIVPGQVYVAPDGVHMKAHRTGTIRLSKEQPENGLRPSISVLFRSVAELYGHRAIGVVLTGMGSDGARELKLMKEKGAVTIAQDLETSVVHGMPGEAIRIGAATYILAAGKIADCLLCLVDGVDEQWRDKRLSNNA